MNLKEAINIGYTCDGYVKCTYAELHSTIGAKVWSVQRSVYALNDARKGISAADEDLTMTENGLVVDYPIVMISGDPVYSPDGKWVQVELTDWCKEFILRKWEKSKHYASEYNKKQDLNRWRLIKLLDQPLWVKEVAIEWIPTDVINAKVISETTGAYVDLNQQIEVSKAKLDKAKALLVAAGATMII